MTGTVITIAACIVTAYSPNDATQGTGSQTSTGTSAFLPGCAVDPEVIPYGSRLSVDGGKTWVTADDTGGAIRGNRIDLRLRSREECIAWGRQTLPVIVRTYSREQAEPVSRGEARDAERKQAATVGTRMASLEATANHPSREPAQAADKVDAQRVQRPQDTRTPNVDTRPTIPAHHEGTGTLDWYYGAGLGVIGAAIAGGYLRERKVA